MSRTRRVDAVEQRVLGALLEKEQATPDHYPLTLNALIAACNQKSNREPVTAYSEGEVRDALERLRRDVLVWRAEGPRAERWEHRLDARWHLDPASKAIVTLLLLRGPQTPGELRSRSERLHAFPDVRVVEATLERMAGEEDPLVEELRREPGQRESRWRHTMGSEDESEVQLETGSGRALRQERPERIISRPEEMDSTRGLYVLESRLARLEETVAELKDRMRELESRLFSGSGRDDF